METIGNWINAVKDFYLSVSDWISRHPHYSLLIAVGAFVAAVKWL